VPIEIEKKYRITKKQRGEVLLRLPEIGTKRKGEEFEENTLYTGEALEMGRSVLRLRRIINAQALYSPTKNAFR
jgi:adenylate cyclase class IV